MSGQVEHMRFIGKMGYCVTVFDAHTCPVDIGEYVGRACPPRGLKASPLANPFSVEQYGRDMALACYQEMLTAALAPRHRQGANAIRAEFSRLLDRLRREEHLVLVCWCTDSGAACHASLLACALLSRVGKGD